MRNFTGKKLFLTVMSASYTLRGFAQDARGAINDIRNVLEKNLDQVDGEE